jgi:hypothetical protein
VTRRAVALLLTIACRPATPESAVTAELIRLGAEDRADRTEIGTAMITHDTAFARRLLRSDSLRTARLREIVATHGWPVASRDGPAAVRAAWLILQHSADTAWQRRLLPALDAAAAAGEIARGEVAMLTDRVLVRDGRPQRYGSAFKLEGGRYVPYPIEDAERVDQRRAAVGLQPMEDYATLLRQMFGVPVAWPPRRDST